MSTPQVIDRMRSTVAVRNLPDNESRMKKLQGRILVVDDSGDGRTVVGRVLKCLGLTVETAENGEVACQRALAALGEQKPFDLILMDMHMPVMDGYAATANLRQQGYSGRIAALTADVNAGVREGCFKVGCDDFATKPIDFEALLNLATRNLQPKKCSSIPEDSNPADLNARSPRPSSQMFA